MSSKIDSKAAAYVMATGPAAVKRLHLLHRVYSPVGRRILLQAGLQPGMRVADFGCGVGAVTHMIAKMVGSSGWVTGIDLEEEQLEQARLFCESEALGNTDFVKANACATGLRRNSFDVAYTRLLLMHLKTPALCLREMWEVLRPGGILVVEDADISSCGSIPCTDVDSCASLFTRTGTARGVDYTLGKKLFHLVSAAGFSDVNVEIHQPALIERESRFLPKWSVEEAASAIVDAGLVTEMQLRLKLDGMQRAIDDPSVLILAPRMFSVWGRRA